MRAVAAVWLAGAVVALAFAAPSAGSKPTRYLRLTATAHFVAHVGYGPFDPQSALNGDYSRIVSYQMRAIVAVEGDEISVFSGNAVVAGVTQIVDERTKLDYKVPIEQRTPIPLCRGWEGDNRTQERGTGDEGTRFKPAPAAAVVVSPLRGGTLKVAPQGVFATNWGCAEAGRARRISPSPLS